MAKNNVILILIFIFPLFSRPKGPLDAAKDKIEYSSVAVVDGTVVEMSDESKKKASEVVESSKDLVDLVNKDKKKDEEDKE